MSNAVSPVRIVVGGYRSGIILQAQVSYIPGTLIDEIRGQTGRAPVSRNSEEEKIGEHPVCPEIPSEFPPSLIHPQDENSLLG